MRNETHAGREARDRPDELPAENDDDAVHSGAAEVAPASWNSDEKYPVDDILASEVVDEHLHPARRILVQDVETDLEAAAAELREAARKLEACR